MKRISVIVLLATFLAATSVTAQQQALTRCQCSYEHWVGDCKASIELRGNWFKVTSSTQQCSRVDWYANEHPKVTVVTDGAEMEQWLGQDTNPKVTVQSCKVCRDANYRENASSPAPTVRQAEPSPDPQSNSPARSGGSPFAGRWIERDRNIFGFTNTTVHNVTVTGNLLSDTFSGSNASGTLSGTINGNEATISCPNCFTTTWRLVNPTTIQYSYPYGSGTLTKE